MKQKDKQTYTWDKKMVIIGVCIGLFGVLQFLVFNSYLFILRPAINSHTANCNVDGLNQNTIEEYGIRGIYSVSTDEISILVEKNHTDYKRILKHEQCHQRQARQHRSQSCKNAVGDIIQEMECYLISGESWNGFIKFNKNFNF